MYIYIYIYIYKHVCMYIYVYYIDDHWTKSNDHIAEELTVNNHHYLCVSYCNLYVYLFICLSLCDFIYFFHSQR